MMKRGSSGLQSTQAYTGTTQLVRFLVTNVFIQANVETNVKANGRAKQKSNPR
jgi:hypothetical protein